jgi:glutamine synthetase
MAIFAEYIWIDGAKPTAKLRSKTKVIHSSVPIQRVADFPDWGFDGSSTEQAEGMSSDCYLKPVAYAFDPTRSSRLTHTKGGHHSKDQAFLVMCEVFEPDGETPHPTNTRAKLREVLSQNGAAELDAWFGMEQEYTLFKGTRPLGFPDNGYPAPQGPYYCGVGDDEVSGRQLVESHLFSCVAAGLKISGINAEVMPGQWEFQVGPCGPLEVGDQLWFARWLLYRLGENYGVNATLDPKPVRGDWNGAGMHTNFSTFNMRTNGPHDKDVDGPFGIEAIEAWCKAASSKVNEHLAVYGHGYQDRLTGAHETARFDEFGYGVSDRTKSIRIPLATSLENCGYLEDRRPNANADPYEVAAAMLKTATGQW